MNWLHPPAPRRPLRAWIAAAAGLGLLLTAFVLIVRQAVRQGEAQRRTHALLLEANWRCKALVQPRHREACLRLYLAERPPDSPGVQALVQTATTAAPPALPRGPARP